jgi:hypothetical protein
MSTPQLSAVLPILIIVPIGLVWLFRKVGLIRSVDKSLYTPKTGKGKAKNAFIYVLAVPLGIAAAYFLLLILYSIGWT